MKEYSVKWVEKDVRLYPAVPYKSWYRAVVLLEDHERALAELNREIAKLTGERDKYKKEALAKFDCEACSGSLQDEHDKLRADYHALLTKAVKFAEEIYKMSTPPERAYRINDVIQDFFSHPHVQAYIKEQYERR